MKIFKIVATTPCDKHEAGYGNPCFTLLSGVWHDYHYWGVCNDRARRAGMTGYISKHSLRTNPSDRKLQATTGGKQQRQPRHQKRAA